MASCRNQPCLISAMVLFFHSTKLGIATVFASWQWHKYLMVMVLGKFRNHCFCELSMYAILYPYLYHIFFRTGLSWAQQTIGTIRDFWQSELRSNNFCKNITVWILWYSIAGWRILCILDHNTTGWWWSYLSSYETAVSVKNSHWRDIWFWIVYTKQDSTKIWNFANRLVDNCAVFYGRDWWFLYY